MATTKRRNSTSRAGGDGKEYSAVSKKRRLSMSMDEFRKLQQGSRRKKK